MRRWIFATTAILALIVLLLVAAFGLSPWPGVHLIRMVFDRGAAAVSEQLKARVPPEVTTTVVPYDPNDRDAVMDIYRLAHPAADMPVIVWIHGGGFVSGQRADVANYLKILAGKGFVVANVDYTIAPEAHYPTPVRQVAKALNFLHQEGDRLGIIEPSFVLAGDSAGAQIAARTVALATSPAYRRLLGIDIGEWRENLSGVILFCGVYDINGMGHGGGILGWFVHTTGWAYSGSRNWRDSQAFASINFTPYLSSDFPAAFVSVGNADPLGPQSVALAQALQKAGVPVETLFFPTDYQPGLGHEYQFDMNSEAGRLALERLTTWLRQL